MTMREKIAEIVFDKLGAAFHGNTGNIMALELADAIVASISDTIPPLVWKTGTSSRFPSSSGEYIIAECLDRGGGVCWAVLFKGAALQSSHQHEKIAQDRADRHNRKEVMAKVTGEKT